MEHDQTSKKISDIKSLLQQTKNILKYKCVLQSSAWPQFWILTQLLQSWYWFSSGVSHLDKLLDEAAQRSGNYKGTDKCHGHKVDQNRSWGIY